MRRAKKRDTVRVLYAVRLEDGTIVDASDKDEPLQFTLGAKEVIKGFQDAVVGMAVGEKKTAEVRSHEAYGPYNKDLKFTVKRSQLPANIGLSEGLHLQMQQPDGRILNVLVKEFDDQEVTVDGNHPFAGKTLKFDVELIDIVNPEIASPTG